MTMSRRESLSPFLFDIDRKRLSVLFKRASTSGLFKGIHCGNGMYMSYLQYADNILVFIPNHFIFIINAKLKDFEMV